MYTRIPERFRFLEYHVNPNNETRHSRKFGLLRASIGSSRVLSTRIPHRLVETTIKDIPVAERATIRRPTKVLVEKYGRPKANQF